jgi:hypothetical protein
MKKLLANKGRTSNLIGQIGDANTVGDESGGGHFCEEDNEGNGEKLKNVRVSQKWFENPYLAVFAPSIFQPNNFRFELLSLLSSTSQQCNKDALSFFIILCFASMRDVSRTTHTLKLKRMRLGPPTKFLRWLDPCCRPVASRPI